MATIEIKLDTKDKENVYIAIDGKKIENVKELCMYNLGEPEYMHFELVQRELVKNGEGDEDEYEDGDLMKTTVLRASENEWIQTPKEDVKMTDEDRKAFAKLVLRK